MAELDGGGKTLGIGAAVAFDHDAVEAEKDPAVGLARIHQLAQLPERRAGKQVADPRAQRPAHCGFEVLADLARRALGGLERDIAGKAFGDDDVDGAFADIVAFDEAEIAEAGQFALAENTAGFAYLFEALGLLDAD